LQVRWDNVPLLGLEPTIKSLTATYSPGLCSMVQIN
jgi:hypothetical protein